MDINKIKVVLVAGGVGKRMGKEVPKQFLVINGKPIIIHTIQRFLEVFPAENLIVTIKENQFSQWNSFLNEFKIKGLHTTYGGEHRTDSVRNGLKAVKENDPQFSGYVLIHDAVRPFISKSFLQNFISQLLTNHKALITACPVKNSLRKITENGTIAVNREEFWEVQTPQGFLFSEIYEAYSQTQKNFSDDASLYESYFSNPVVIAEYIPENIKITTIIDLILAEYLFKNGF